MISFQLMFMSFLLFSGGLGAKSPGFVYLSEKKYFLNSLVNLAKIEEKPCLMSPKLKTKSPIS